MFLTKEEIEKELKEEDCWSELSPKERKMFLLYVTNGHDELEAYNDIYVEGNEKRVTKFPGSKAANIIAKEAWQECFRVYAELLQEMVSVKANAHIWNYYWTLASYNIFDFITPEGYFRYDSIEEAQEKLGIKACVITGIETSMHPKYPEKTVQKVSLYPREKALKELTKYTKFYGEAEIGGGGGISNIVINTGSSSDEIDVEQDEIKRKKYGLA